LRRVALFWMSIPDSTNSLSADAATSASEEVKDGATTESSLVAGLVDLCAAEHPAVMGGRVGACVFSSFAFPGGLWLLGSVDETTAALIATVLTLVATRPILLLGGTRIARVLTLQITIAVVALASTFPMIPSLLLGAFFPLLGMMLFVSSSAQLASSRFARDDRPQEADVVVARATQANVVDIRAAGIARRAGAKTATRPVSDPPATPAQPHQQAK